MCPSVCKADRGCAPGRVGFRWLSRPLSFGFGFVEVLVGPKVLGKLKMLSAKKRKRTLLRNLGYIYILKKTAKLKIESCSPKQVCLIQFNILIAKAKQLKI